MSVGPDPFVAPRACRGLWRWWLAVSCVCLPVAWWSFAVNGGVFVLVCAGVVTLLVGVQFALAWTAREFDRRAEAYREISDAWLRIGDAWREIAAVVDELRGMADG